MLGRITGAPYCWKEAAAGWWLPPCGGGREPHCEIEAVGDVGRDTFGGVVALSGMIGI
jgi:hypothetical protein